MDMDFIVSWLQSGVRLAAPLILVSIGSVYAERSGVLYVGMEGSMLAGAFTSVAVTLFTGNLFLAAIAAMVAGGLLALVHAYVTVSRRAGQIASGIGIGMLALGATNFAEVARCHVSCIEPAWIAQCALLRACDLRPIDNRLDRIGPAAGVRLVSIPNELGAQHSSRGRGSPCCR